MIFEKAFEPAKRFLAVIGASVGGLTAIFYVVGFLAVQAHHRFLGLTHISVDLNQYLYSGGLFFAAFPWLAIYFWDRLLEIPARNFEWFLFALIAIALAGLLLRIKWIKNLVGSLGIRLGKLAVSCVTMIQIVFNLVLLIVFISFSLEIVNQDNWLFADGHPDYAWLVGTTHENSNRRQQHFVGLLGLAILSILVHALLEYWRRQPNPKSGEKVRAPWRSIFSITALLLIILQLLYLPINYGLLLIPNSYPTAEFGLRHTKLDSLPTSGQPLVLIHRESDDYYFYSREHKKIWQIRRSDMNWITRMGDVHIFDQRSARTHKGSVH